VRHTRQGTSYGEDSEEDSEVSKEKRIESAVLRRSPKKAENVKLQGM